MTSYSDAIKTPLARIAFPNLLKAQRVEKTRNGKTETVDEYNCTLLFPKDSDISAIKKIILDAATAEWGGKAADMLKNGAIKNPILDGDGPQAVSKKSGQRHKGFEGHVFVRVATRNKPKLFNGKVHPIDSEEELYAGVYGYAAVNAYTWDAPQQGKGVSLSLQMLQVVKRGEKLGGREYNPNEFFEKIEGADDDNALDDNALDASSLF